MKNVDPSAVVIREVGLRDGLQSIARTLPTEHKLAWLRAAYAAGQREIEVGSFVPARLLPQLADTAELVAAAKALPGLVASVLVPNLKGAQAALDSGADSMLLPISASHAHSLANLRRTPDEAVAELGRIRAARDAAGSKCRIEVGLSHRLRLHDPGPGRGIGGAAPDAGGARRRRRCGRPRRHRGLRRPVAGDAPVRAGARDRRRAPRPAAISTTPAASGWRTSSPPGRSGVRRFDACLGGIGGCPHAPGASGNVATEDVAYLFASMGVPTGLDFDALIALRAQLARWLEGEPLHGTIARAGLPRTMRRPHESSVAIDEGRSDERPPQPLAGLRVVELTHMVMGPTCGMVLADLGAEVIKVEPIDGEGTRRLLGAGAGFFPMFNRNKKSVGIDLRRPEGAEVGAAAGALGADVVAENFKPGALVKFGLDYASLAAANDRLIYVSHKGFLPGPYEHRTALDEVVQMMGGLAYMTGRPGDPLRAGTSVNDIMGGLFGAIGALGALIQRGITGKGMEVQSALFENNVFLMGQHMLQYAMTGHHPAADARARQPVGDLRRVHGRRTASRSSSPR